MGLFNTVLIPWQDPATGQETTLTIQFKYAEKRQHEYRIGDALKWGGDRYDVGKQASKRVVVYGILETDPEPGVPEDYDIYVEEGVITSVVPASPPYDVAQSPEGFIVLEE